MEDFVNKCSVLEDSTTSVEESFDPRVINRSLNEEINQKNSVEEIMAIVKKLKNNKAHGIDNIINEFLKNCPEYVMVAVVQLFNLVLNTGIIPTDWSIGSVVPLYKNKGSFDDPDNYRGITLLSCLGKLFTAAINARHTSYLESIGILGDEQAGFRAGCSTLDHIFVLHIFN